MAEDGSTSEVSQFSISAVSQRTGLSPHVIRVWERRYGAVRPGRKANGRRIYCEEDINRLSLLSRLVNLGQPIGQVAGLGRDDLYRQIDAMTMSRKEASEPVPGHLVLRDTLLKSVLDNARSYDIESCCNALAGAVIGISVDELITDVCSPLMRIVGEEWQAGRLNEAQEHIIASAFMSFFLPRVTSSLTRKNAPAVVFSTFQGDRHQMGLLFVATMAAARNLRCFYLGADLPEGAIADAVQRVDAKVVCISIVNKASPKTLSANLAVLRDLLPREREIWVGGFGFEGPDFKTLPANCHAPGKFELGLRLDRLAFGSL